VKFLDDAARAGLRPAEELPHFTPIPTQMVSSDEYVPAPQTPQQRELEARLLAIGETLAKRQGVSRRRFFQTAAGMAAAYVALNETFGMIFEASRAEAATPEMADARAKAFKDQFILDMHTHFLRDDTRLTGFVAMRDAVGRAGWNQDLSGKEQTIEDLKFENYVKEIFLDSDTKIAQISSAPSDIARDWFLTNQQMAEARTKVNARFGSKRLYAHAIFTPGQPGWLEAIDAALQRKPDAMKGYTIGDNTHKEISHFPWRMDDEKLAYKAYEKFVKAGVRNVCVHKGLFPVSLDQTYPHLRPFAGVSDVGRAARDWPQLNFIIYHSAYRHVGGDPAQGLEEFQKTGRLSWVTDLAEIPQQYGVSNVYCDTGQIFAVALASQPRVVAAIMGTLIKGMGVDHVCWGSDAVWTGSPQWQIEGLRRLEIPEEMQKTYGYSPLGPADGPIKNAIFGGNSARLYGIEQSSAQREMRGDKLTHMKADYEIRGPEPSNLRYGYVAGPADHVAPG
jgi:predicted TIM-barrel fold metal-dependent hydrolase